MFVVNKNEEQPISLNDKNNIPLSRISWSLAAFRYGYAWALVVLLVTLGVTFAAWQSERQDIEHELQTVFDIRVRNASDRLLARMKAYEHILRGVDGLFAGSESVERDEFRGYLNKLKVADVYPGIQGVGFSLWVPPNKKSAHVATVRREGYPEYVIKPMGERESYTPIIYLEPFTGSNLRAFGYDMYSEPVRRAAMEQARDSGNVVISGKVTLVQEMDQQAQAGFLMYLPVYRHDSLPNSIEERRASLIGWVYAPFRMGDLMAGLYDEQADDMEVEIYDGREVFAPALMYSLGGGSGYHFQTTKSIDIADHAWTVRYRMPDGFKGDVSHDGLNLIAWLGIGISLLLTLITLLLTHARQLATLTARKMTRRAHKSKLALEATVRELEFLRRTLDEHAIVSVANADGNIIHVNQQLIDLSGYRKDELLGSNHVILKSGVHSTEFYQELWNTLLRGDVWHGEVCNRRKDGSLFWVRSTIMPFLNASDLPERYVSVRTDITQLKEAESRWAFAVEGAGDGVWDWNMLTGEMTLSGCYESMLGYAKGELLETVEAWLKSVHPDDMDGVQANLQDYLAGKTPAYVVELRLYCKDGSYKWVLCRGQIVQRDTQGKPVRMIGIHSDIHVRKHLEKDVYRQKEVLERFSETMSEGLIVQDTQGCCIYMNSEAERLLGWSRAEFIGKHVYDTIHRLTPDMKPITRDDCLIRLAIIANGSWRGDEQVFTRKDGSIFPVEANSRAVVVEGKAEGCVVTFQNISKRKEHEEILSQTKDRLDLALRGSDLGLWDWDIPHGRVHLNERGGDVIKGEAVAMTLPDEQLFGLPDPEYSKVVKDSMVTVLKGKSEFFSVDFSFKRHDGKRIWVNNHGKVVERDGAGRAVRLVGFFADITQRQEAVDKQMKSEERLRLLFESTTDSMILFDNKQVLDCNAATLEMFRFKSKEKFLRIHLEDILPAKQSNGTDSKVLARQQIASALDTGSSRFEWVHQRIDTNEFFAADVLLNAVDFDGKKVIQASIRDISKRNKIETMLLKAKDAAERANQAKSEFLAGMSHELRTPLNAILGFAQLLEGDPSCTEDQTENLQEISKAGWHLLNLINEVLDLARVEAGAIEINIVDIDLSRLVEECLSLTKPLTEHKPITIENQIGLAAPKVRGDYMRLKQVLLNFLSNAVKYNRDDGKVVLGWKSDVEGMCVLSVRDTGRGMSAEQLNDLFEPFSRFGDTGKVQGTGIGLSISKKLVERMNGRVEVESVYGEGSEFSIILPLCGEIDEATVRAETAHVSLLYIEDDPVQQSLLGAWAIRKGWHVEFVNDATTGIEAAMRLGHDAILLDIALPGGFSGLDVKSVFDDVESLRHVPIIGIGNHVDIQDIDRATQAVFYDCLVKPVDLIRLECLVEDIIGKRNTNDN